MKGIEAAIRKALSKPGMEDPQQRERVYDSARKALANGLQERGLGGTERALRQASALEELIDRIEDAYWAEPPAPDLGLTAEAADSDDFAVDVPPVPEAGEPGRSHRDEPEEPAFSDGMLETAPGRIDPVGMDVSVDPPEARHAVRRQQPAKRDRRQQPRRGARNGKRRRPIYSIILVAALIVAFVGMGAVWLIVSGALQSPQQRDTSVPNPPATVDSEDFAGLPSPDGAFSGDWIDVFTPRDAATVAGSEAVDLELFVNGGRDALRIVSHDGGKQGEAVFELAPGLLQNLAGGKALVALTMRSSGDAPTQIYVRCELPGGGDCGRRRFDVTYEAGDVIFSLDLSKAGGATDPGFLALNSDISGGGNGVDIYGIRMRPE